MRTRILTCLTVPALAMTAAHYIPWRQSMGRELHRLEAYSIGTSAIVATAAIAMATDNEGTGRDHAGLLVASAASAGAATILCWLWDHVLDLRRTLAEIGAYGDALSYIRQDRD